MPSEHRPTHPPNPGTFPVLALCSWLCFGIPAGAAETPPSHEDKGSLVVSITGIRNQNGQLLVRLYDSAEGFPRDATSIREVRKLNPVRAGQMEVSFEALPYGEYAVCVMHDEDRNGDMTYRLYLLPAEGYCFSRNFRPRFRPPSFDKVSVTLDQPERTIELKLRY